MKIIKLELRARFPEVLMGEPDMDEFVYDPEEKEDEAA